MFIQHKQTKGKTNQVWEQRRRHMRTIESYQQIVNHHNQMFFFFSFFFGFLLVSTNGHGLTAGCAARICNPAYGKLDSVDDLNWGTLLRGRTCWSDVRTELITNMDPFEESGGCRLAKEERNGPGRTLSSQKFPCWAVVGSRPWMSATNLSRQDNQTSILFCHSSWHLHFNLFFLASDRGTQI